MLYKKELRWSESTSSKWSFVYFQIQCSYKWNLKDKYICKGTLLYSAFNEGWLNVSLLFLLVMFYQTWCSLALELKLILGLGNSIPSLTTTCYHMTMKVPLPITTEESHPVMKSMRCSWKHHVSVHLLLSETFVEIEVLKEAEVSV